MSSGQFFSLAGWTFLPNLVTGWVQSVWYGITIRAGDPKPQPGTLRYVQHRRRIHILVISAYLVYTIYEADWDIRRASDFYQDLGVSHSALERDVKSRFRRLAALHHPDKVSQSSLASEAYFMHLKLAQDTLMDPVKRFAYDRFGPEVTQWRHCSSIREYLVQGLNYIGQYYGAGAVLMYTLGLMGYLNWGRYWRWIVMMVLCVFELYTVSRPFFPPVAAKLLNPLLLTFTLHPPYLPFQLIQLTRKLSITMYIGFSQIGPLLQSSEEARRQGDQGLVLGQQLDRLEQSTKAADVEASRLMDMEKAPFSGDADAVRNVQVKIKEWLVQNTIRMDPEVRDAVGKFLKKHRVDALAGAKGNM